MKAKWLSTLLIVMMLFIAVGPIGVAGAARTIRDVSPQEDSPDLKPLPFDRADIHNANPQLGPAQIGQTARSWNQAL